MNFAEAKLKYGKELGKLKRRDFNDNFMKHYDTEIRAFCAETKLDFGEAANLFSPEPEKVNGRYRPQDATIDLLAYRGHRIYSEPGIPASPAKDFFSDEVVQDSKNPSYELGVSYLQNIWRNILDFGNGVDPRYSYGYQRQINSAFSRSDLNRTIDPHETGALETDRRFRARLRIADVVAMQEPLKQRTIDIPVVEEVGDRSDRGTGGRRLPRESMGVSDTTIRMSETGRELEIQDTVRRSSTITIQMIAEHQANRALREENGIVNDIIDIIGTGAEEVAWSADPTSEDVIKLHLTPDDDYMITTFAGTLMAVVKYADVDPTYMSDVMKQGAPARRNFLDAILGRETIAKRDPAKVPALGTDKERFICWDRPNTFVYYTERDGTITDMYRSEETRSFILRNVVVYGGRLKEDAEHTRWRVTLG